MVEEKKISYAVPDAETFNENDATMKTYETVKKKKDFVTDNNEKYYDGKVFQFNVLGDELIEDLHIVNYHNKLYVYDDGYYRIDDKIIENAIDERCPSIKKSSKNEVLSYILIRSHIDNKIEPEPYIITTNNVRINLKTDEIIPFSPDFIEFIKLPVTYDPNARCEAVDCLLFNVFQDNQKLIDLFIECLGSIIIKQANGKRAVLFVGDGANGKSTILEMLQVFVGKDNYSTVPLEHLCDRFRTAELDRKLANISDDIQYKVPIKDTTTIKKLIQGIAIMVEKRWKDPFRMRSYATHIYTCHSIPKSLEYSYGFDRLWSVIPFNAKFSQSDPDFDPFIIKKVTTPEALSYLLNLAIKGAKTIITRGWMDALKDFYTWTHDSKNSNTTIMQWINDENLNQAFFLNRPMSEYYELYTQWCDDSGVSQAEICSKIAFYAELRNGFGFDKKPWQRNDGKRFFKITQ